MLHQSCSGGRPPIHINYDETNVRLHLPTGKGHLVITAHKRKQEPRSLTRNVTRGETRASATHLLSISDDPAVQEVLPQFIILNKHLVSEAVFAEIRASLPPNMYALREAKGWANSSTMIMYAKKLAEHVAPLRCNRSIVVFGDVYKAHTSVPVLTAFGAYRLLVCFVPAKMTWALQPCDTEAFAIYKRGLGTKLEREALESDTGRIGWLALVKAIRDVIRDVINTRSWAKAFDDVGLRGTQLTLSPRCRNKLELGDSEPTATCNGFPSLENLQNILPNKSNVPVRSLFAGLLKRAGEDGPAKVSVEGSGGAPSAPPAVATSPWFGRTRSTSRSQLDSSASFSSGPWPSKAMAAPPPPPPAIPFLPNAKRLPRRALPSSLPPLVPLPHPPAEK